MQINFGDEIKSRLSMKEVAQMYGFHVNSRANTMLCPFHDDHHNSMHVYPGKRGFFCYSCNSGGSVIDFVMKLFDLNFIDACKKMNEDFRLGLPIDKELTEQQRREAEEASKKRKAEMEARRNREKMLFTAYHAALDRYCALDRMKMENLPVKDKLGNYKISKTYVYAIKRIDSAWNDVQEAAAKLYQFEKEGKSNEQQAIH